MKLKNRNIHVKQVGNGKCQVFWETHNHDSIGEHVATITGTRDEIVEKINRLSTTGAFGKRGELSRARKVAVLREALI